MRVYEATVPREAEGMRLDGYIASSMPLLPARAVKSAFLRRDVKVDGRRTDADATVMAGSVVRLYTDYAVELPVVYEDERVLVINKPAGISCGDDGRGGMTVLSLTADRGARLCHRLDNPTSGLLLLCKDDESERLLLEAFRERRMKKIYQCLVRGEMRPPADTKEAYLVKDAERARVRIVTHETPGAQKIVTRYETMDFDGEISRLRVTLLTGRTHQIRAHLSFLSHPILGDDKYGDRALNRRKKVRSLRLCATEMTLYPGGELSYLDGRTFSIEPPF